MIFIYRISLFIYHFAAIFLSLFDSKAQKFVQGQKRVLDKIAFEKIATQHPVWFHCASLGEFEQARPLIDGFYKSGEKVLLTFFSPSGYEHRHNYEKADWVFYLPMDSPKNATQFISLTQPKAAIFVKYDLWYFYLKRLHESRTPTYLVSAIYQKDQIYFSALLGGLHRKMLGLLDHIYLQDTRSQQLLQSIEIYNTSVVGDTRVDSVLARAQNVAPIPPIEKFLEGNQAIILGSAYLEEVQILSEIYQELANEKIIIAPHDIHPKNIGLLRSILPKESVLYSNIKDSSKVKSNILIIDNIGILFSVYQYGKWAFIGGAFGKGLHNVLEPAAFDLPICFGPKFQKFAEAVCMIQQGTAKEIKRSNDLKALYLALQDENVSSKLAKRIQSYMHESKGASERIHKEVSLQI